MKTITILIRLIQIGLFVLGAKLMVVTIELSQATTFLNQPLPTLITLVAILVLSCCIVGPICVHRLWNQIRNKNNSVQNTTPRVDPVISMTCVILLIGMFTLYTWAVVATQLDFEKQRIREALAPAPKYTWSPSSLGAQQEKGNYERYILSLEREKTPEH